METKISSAKKEEIISDKRPTMLIGERINSTGKPKLAAALQAGKPGHCAAGNDYPSAGGSGYLGRKRGQRQ